MANDRRIDRFRGFSLALVFCTLIIGSSLSLITQPSRISPVEVPESAEFASNQAVGIDCIKNITSNGTISHSKLISASNGIVWLYLQADLPVELGDEFILPEIVDEKNGFMGPGSFIQRSHLLIAIDENLCQIKSVTGTSYSSLASRDILWNPNQIQPDLVDGSIYFWTEPYAPNGQFYLLQNGNWTPSMRLNDSEWARMVQVEQTKYVELNTTLPNDIFNGTIDDISNASDEIIEFFDSNYSLNGSEELESKLYTDVRGAHLIRLSSNGTASDVISLQVEVNETTLTYPAIGFGTMYPLSKGGVIARHMIIEENSIDNHQYLVIDHLQFNGTKWIDTGSSGNLNRTANSSVNISTVALVPPDYYQFLQVNSRTNVLTRISGNLDKRVIGELSATDQLSGGRQFHVGDWLFPAETDDSVKLSINPTDIYFEARPYLLNSNMSFHFEGFSTSFELKLNQSAILNIDSFGILESIDMIPSDPHQWVRQDLRPPYYLSLKSDTAQMVYDRAVNYSNGPTLPSEEIQIDPNDSSTIPRMVMNKLLVDSMYPSQEDAGLLMTFSEHLYSTRGILPNHNQACCGTSAFGDRLFIETPNASATRFHKLALNWSEWNILPPELNWEVRDVNRTGPYLMAVDGLFNLTWTMNLRDEFNLSWLDSSVPIDEHRIMLLGPLGDYPADAPGTFQRLEFNSTTFMIISDVDDDGVPDNRDMCTAESESGWFIANGSNDWDSDGCLDATEDRDDDDDGVLDVDDNCPRGFMNWGRNTTSDRDDDGCRDFDEDLDDDGDGVGDLDDSCPEGALNWNSEYATDRDGDGCRDSDEDEDDDGDTIPDIYDDCPRGEIGWNSTQASDVDNDGCRDSGEDLDDDNDNVEDSQDDCSPGELYWNSTFSSDHDSDGCRDNSEDIDDDGDSVLDESDTCPTGDLNWTSTYISDYDGDGCNDLSEDDDDDGDGVIDANDSCNKGDLLWHSSPLTDHDFDGCQDSKEDSDDDDDSIMDWLDSCPRGKIGWNQNSVTDYDSDGCRDSIEDDDDDNDGILDINDNCPLGEIGWRSTTETDNDSDGCPDLIVQSLESSQPSLFAPTRWSLATLVLALLLFIGYSDQPLRLKMLGRVGFFALIGEATKANGNHGRRRRQELLRYITNNPGTHFTEIVRTVELGRGQAGFHLMIMENEGLIWKKRCKRRLCYFPASLDSYSEKADYISLLCTLETIDRCVLQFLGEAGQSNFVQGEIANALDVSQPTISRSIRRLRKMELIHKEVVDSIGNILNLSDKGDTLRTMMVIKED